MSRSFGRPCDRPPDPTPEEIARECEAIQKTWTKEEKAKRLVMRSVEVDANPKGHMVVAREIVSEFLSWRNWRR